MRTHSKVQYADRTKAKLVEVVLPLWDFIKDVATKFAIEHQNYSKNAISIRTARAQTTKRIRRWVEGLPIGLLVQVNTIVRIYGCLDMNSEMSWVRIKASANAIVLRNNPDGLMIKITSFNTDFPETYVGHEIGHIALLLFKSGTRHNVLSPLKKIEPPCYTSDEITLVTPYDNDPCYTGIPSPSQNTNQ
jgi:hypothetical protein